MYIIHSWLSFILGYIHKNQTSTTDPSNHRQVTTPPAETSKIYRKSINPRRLVYCIHTRDYITELQKQLTSSSSARSRARFTLRNCRAREPAVSSLYVYTWFFEDPLQEEVRKKEELVVCFSFNYFPDGGREKERAGWINWDVALCGVSQVCLYCFIFFFVLLMLSMRKGFKIRM